MTYTLDDIDIKLVADVCQSNAIANKLVYLILQNTEQDYPNINDRIDAIAWDYADHTMDIWTEDTHMDPQDFWDKNYYWAVDVLNTLLDRIEEAYIHVG